MEIKEKYDVISKKLKELHEKIEKPKVVIGLSGGIDSAVVATLLVDTIGKENMIAVNMPSKHNSYKIRGIANRIANNLGIEYRVIEIQDMIDSMVLKVTENYHTYISSVKMGNIGARIRNSVLQSIADSENNVMVCSINKLEYITGYTTYPDIGFCSPIGDLNKIEVFELANYLNEKFGKEVIPSELLPYENMEFDVFPSAELEDGQKDPFLFGLDCELIDLIDKYQKEYSNQNQEEFAVRINNIYFDGFENGTYSGKYLELYKMGPSDRLLKRILYLLNLFYKSEFKRKQAPPIIKCHDEIIQKQIKKLN